MHGQGLHRDSAGGACTLGHGFSSPAGAADEALGVVGPPQGGDDLSSDEVPTTVTAGPIELLVVVGADVLLVLEEEARLGQVAAAHCRGGHAPVKGAAGRSSPRAQPGPLSLFLSPRAPLETQLSAGTSEGFPSHQMGWSLSLAPQDVSVGLWQGAGWCCPARAGRSHSKAQHCKGNPCRPHSPRTNIPEGPRHPFLDPQHLDGAQCLYLTLSRCQEAKNRTSKESGMP